METVDERLVRASVNTMFEIASRVENWPAHLSHYRYVRFRERRSDGGGLVEMSAARPFHIIDTSRVPLRFNWPTWWLSEMSVNESDPSIRFRHVGGVTKGMDVEWSFRRIETGVRIAVPSVRRDVEQTNRRIATERVSTHRTPEAPEAGIHSHRSNSGIRASGSRQAYCRTASAGQIVQESAPVVNFRRPKAGGLTDPLSRSGIPATLIPAHRTASTCHAAIGVARGFCKKRGSRRVTSP